MFIIKHKQKNKQNGFTLIELMLSMVFGLIVLSGVIYIYIAVISSTSSALKSIKKQ
ncbi:MAG: prepilin-type N-terminal cleavage/methylation domain-containing protein [Thalassotalea sp.]|nr:prepilin-type N-terminal cleavage/methylation domain-containing protein [Thalassotalea sp.]MDG2392495.1 prepilin-type N-terminal cleavage/methylation domain-containing protein [Thalassotalea sp.]